jgi:hypothetical protein
MRNICDDSVRLDWHLAISIKAIRLSVQHAAHRDYRET